MHAANNPVKILLVEDNEMNRDIIVRQLGRIGFGNIALAGNGVEALSWLETNDCSLILTDCQMPLMDGFEMTRTIRRRESPGQKRIYILALSASTMEEDKKRCEEVGMDGHVSKPTQINDLRVALKDWLPRQNTETAAA